MGLFWGLGAALGWGVADFFTSDAARRIGTTRAQGIIQALGLVAIAVLMLWRGDALIFDGAPWGRALGLGVVHFASTWCLYRAFEIGTLSIIGPLASSYVILTAVLAYFGGERTSQGVWWGVILLFVGAVLISRSPHDAGTNRRGWLEASVSAVGFAWVFWQMGTLTQQTSALWPLLSLRACNIVGAWLLWIVIVRKRPLTTQTASPLTPRVPLAVLFVVIAVCDSAAWACLTIGMGATSTTVVTALSSLFSAVTVALAWLFLRERLAPAQWAGVAVILLGVLCVAF